MRLLPVAPVTALLLLCSFIIKKKDKLRLPDEFVFIPAGTFSLHPDTNSIYDEMPRKIETVSSFYSSKYEISNKQYRQFYNEVAAGLPADEKEKIACDSLGWRQELTYCEPMVEYYYQHPAYNDYPAVNIPYEGAVRYCQWLQEKIQKDNPGYSIEVKLPGKIQWIWAAQGGRSQAMYPWGNYYLRNRKGEFMCNFRIVGDGAINRNPKTGKPEVHETVTGISGGLNGKAFYTAAVKSFYPNDYGLYNMCGNAAEMTAEKGIAMGGSWNDYGGDVQIRAEAKYEGPMPTVGFRPIIIATPKQEN